MDNTIFGLSEKALQLTEDRSVLLSENIVNSSTPHYKAKDIDFKKLLEQSESDTTSASLETTNPDHIAGSSSQGPNNLPVMYRIPMQKSRDGNTVDTEIEHKNFLENALHYQVNLTFIENKTNELMQAIKGE